MAGPLTNEGHELFAQALAEGEDQHKAWLKAGFKGGEAVACRAAKRPDVRARILELQTAAAAETVVTIADIARQLDEDRAFAKKCETPAAMVSATMGKAKLLGLLSDRVQLTNPDGSLRPTVIRIVAADVRSDDKPSA